MRADFEWILGLHDLELASVVFAVRVEMHY
jgi:hypothetical protein